jgi:hypothetical protein
MASGSPIGQRTGIVWIDDFDRGVVETLGAVVNTAGDTYIVKDIDGVSPPPDREGIPVYFAFPDDTIDTKILPSFVVRRDSISPALSRWHLGLFEYRVPAPGAHEITVKHPVTGNTIATGFDKYEAKDQAVPFDLLYTIQIRARFRNNLRVEAQRMLRYAMVKYQPYTRVLVKDSLGDIRSYDAFMESPSAVDTKTDVANRETNFNLTLRVEAELDLNDPIVQTAMSQLPVLNTQILK